MNRETNLSGKQPTTFSLFCWLAPLVVFRTLISGELESMLKTGSYSPDVVYLGVTLAATLLCIVPLALFVGRVSVTDQAIIGFRYLGPRTRISWGDEERAELFEVTTKKASKKTLRLIPKRGRRIVFQSQVSNFDLLEAAVEGRSPVSLIKHPPRPAVGHYQI